MYYLFLFLFSILSADDFEASFSGTVSRSEGEIPLSGANVTLTNKQGKSYGASTDKGGLFNIENWSTRNF